MSQSWLIVHAPHDFVRNYGATIHAMEKAMLIITLWVALLVLVVLRTFERRRR